MRETRGVIDIAGLVGTMQHALASAGELAVDSATQQVKFTSAEFAVQMIEAAGEFTFVPTRAS
jgi:hypothetical protein